MSLGTLDSRGQRRLWSFQESSLVAESTRQRVLAVVPIAWMVLIAFQPPKALVTPGWNLHLTLQNFRGVFGPDQIYSSQVVNSLILVAVATTVCLVVSVLAAYSLSQLNWSRRTVLVVLSVVGPLQVIPPMTLVPGLFSTLNTLGTNGTLWGLILLNVVFNLPFATIMVKFYFGTLPEELHESTSIDRSSEATTFRRVMLPLAAPGIAAVAPPVAPSHPSRSASPPSSSRRGSSTVGWRPSGPLRPYRSFCSPSSLIGRSSRD